MDHRLLAATLPAAISLALAMQACAEGAHSCAGPATQARDLKSFALLPSGDCAKIQSGSLKSG